MITLQLTKLETALDQVKKAYPKLMPADAALVASALSLTGRHALALYEGEQYTWPDDNEKLTKAMVPQMEITQEAIDHNAPKRGAKPAAEEEPVVVNVGLMPNFTAGENLLQERNDLKTLLSDILQDGVEFVYEPHDLKWQWALDRANWSTIAGHEISRRIKVKATFSQGAIGVETGTGSGKKRSRKASASNEPIVEVVPTTVDPDAEPEPTE